MDINFNELEQILGAWGPLAILVLLILPLGEDLIIIPAGVLIGHGTLDFWQTFLFAYVGSFISDAMWYVICYRYGTPLLHKRWFKRLAHPRGLLQAKHQIEKRGAWLIVTARFVPGSRTTTMVVSGLMHLPWWKFVLAEGVCLLVTVPMQLGLGFLIAKGIGTTEGIGKILAVVGVVIGLMVIGFFVKIFMAHRRSNQRAPRAKTAWLKKFRVPRIRASRRGTADGTLTTSAPNDHSPSGSSSPAAKPATITEPAPPASRTSPAPSAPLSPSARPRAGGSLPARK